MPVLAAVDTADVLGGVPEARAIALEHSQASPSQPISVSTMSTSSTWSSSSSSSGNLDRPTLPARDDSRPNDRRHEMPDMPVAARLAAVQVERVPVARAHRPHDLLGVRLGEVDLLRPTASLDVQMTFRIVRVRLRRRDRHSDPPRLSRCAPIVNALVPSHRASRGVCLPAPRNEPSVRSVRQSYPVILSILHSEPRRGAETDACASLRST